MTDISEIKSHLSVMKNNAAKYYEQNSRPSKSASISVFFSNSIVSLRFILTEKENILFAFLSLAVVAFVYLIGIQILSWIPPEVWTQLKEDDDNMLLNIILLIWSFVCIGLAAYPLGICTACMGASYILRFQGRTSTIAECLKVVMPKSWTLWIFSWLDGWWTFLRILERLPKKNDRTPLSVKLRNEAIYQAWKISSLGFLPALVCGRSLADAGKDSLSLLKDRFAMLAKLRIGYSAICWIIGIASYVGNIVIMFYMPMSGHGIYEFYFLAFFPIVAALVFVMLVFRPLYIISACRIYAFYTREKGIEIKLPQTSSKSVSSLVSFLVLAVIMAAVFLYRDELGLSEILADPWRQSASGR